MSDRANDLLRDIQDLLKKHNCEMSAEDWGNSVYFTLPDGSYLELNETGGNYFCEEPNERAN